jgi:hypothetical protein
VDGIKVYDLSRTNFTFLQNGPERQENPLQIGPDGFIYYYADTESFYSPSMHLVK